MNRVDIFILNGWEENYRVGTTISRVLSLGSYLSRRYVTITLKRDTK